MTFGSIIFILLGTYCLMSKMNSIKEFFIGDKIGGLSIILLGCYFGWIAIDCFYEQTLTMSQIKSMGAISIWTILMGYYYIMKAPKTG